MNKIGLLALAAILTTAPAHAADAAAGLREAWFDANNRCRGLSDPVEAQKDCRRRERLTQMLEALGFCVEAHRLPWGGHAENVRPCSESADR